MLLMAFDLWYQKDPDEWDKVHLGGRYLLMTWTFYYSVSG